METYRRPRTYADRKWLEGYMDAAAQIHHKPFSRMHRSQAEMWVWILWIHRVRMYSGKTTAHDRGFIDAILDAFGN